MPTPEELLEKLEERLILGEISEAMYHELRAKLRAKLAANSAGGPMNVSDSVIKGDVSNTTGAASVGNVVFNVPGAAPQSQPGSSLVTCPLCGRRNRPEGVFRCMKCGKDYLCLDHFVASARMCEDCVAKDEALHAETERKRQAEARTQAELEAAEQARREAERRRKAAAATPKSIELDCGGGVAMKLALIPAGEFMMGSPEGEQDRGSDEGPQRRVTISKPFYLGVTQVTQAQWRAVMNTEPWEGESFCQTGPDNPASHVSWDDATAFCNGLSKKTGRTVRLPTEAEWEYACRAGTTTRFYYGDDPDYGKLGDYAWYDGNVDDIGESYAHPVGAKKPNAWGLYDMHGNVFEWCADWYADSYTNADTRDPKGPSSGEARVLRGGSWDGHPQNCRAAYRYGDSPGGRDIDSGFRVVVLPGVGVD